MNSTDADIGSVDPRPPDGDWLGTPYLRFERYGRTACVTVNRPDARNAMTGAMYFGIRYAIDRVASDPDLDNLLLTGAHDVFIPGGDMGSPSIDAWTDFNLWELDATPFDRLLNSPCPVVSAVNGIAQGGGLMTALLSDVAIASERATFRAPEVLRGLADMNFAEILPQHIGPMRARDMLLTGRVVSAEEACAWGIVSRVVEHDRLMEEASATLAACARSEPGAWLQVKRGINNEVISATSVM